MNSFDNNIKFNFEDEDNETLLFLDVLVCRKGKSAVETVFRKRTNNDIYLNWNAFALDTWKRGTLKTLLERAYMCVLLNNFYKKN